MDHMKDKDNDMNKIKNEYNINKKIIESFFELFNKNVELFIKSEIIKCDKNTRIMYLENDNEGNNQKVSNFAVNSLDILIKKLFQDNKELYNQLIETKKVLDEQNNIQSENVIEDLKNNNLFLKKELQNIIKENENFRNENIRLKLHLDELNKYINVNMNNYNKNQINKKNNLNNFNGNQRDDFLYNYKTQQNNDYKVYLLNKGNYNTINNAKNIKDIKDNYNIYNNLRSDIGLEKPMNNNNANNIIYPNNNNSNYNTTEKIKINNNVLLNNNNNYNFNYSNRKENNKIEEYKKTIDHMKNEVSLIEKKMQDSPY
jgi:hypothetical protein